MHHWTAFTLAVGFLPGFLGNLFCPCLLTDWIFVEGSQCVKTVILQCDIHSGESVKSWGVLSEDTVLLTISQLQLNATLLQQSCALTVFTLWVQIQTCKIQ